MKQILLEAYGEINPKELNAVLKQKCIEANREAMFETIKNILKDNRKRVSREEIFQLGIVLGLSYSAVEKLLMKGPFDVGFINSSITDLIAA